jgi:putative RNA 2'-phosphotransferase
MDIERSTAAMSDDASGQGGVDVAKLADLSKALSRVLRHRPDAIDVVLDRHGWCDITALLAGLARHGTPMTRQQLDFIVRTSDKIRFALSEDGQRIRANQGHSVTGVTLDLQSREPPARLYHGTVAAALASIGRQGLQPMRRHHVHLSPDIATARAVGARRGKPFVLAIDAAQMHADGHRFWLSDNRVWLAEVVPPEYLTQLD